MARKVKHSVRRRGTTRLSQKNQVTIPVAALRKSRLQTGDRLSVEATGDGQIVLTRESDPLDEFAGSVPGLSAATDLDSLRDEWDRR